MNFLLSHSFIQTTPLSLTGLVLALGFLSGCAPTVNLATPQPIKVDVGVRLDVYQKTAPTKAKEQQSSLEIAAARRLRSGEIQQLKSDHILGEDRDGYLAMLSKPKDPKYLTYAEGVMNAENVDRSYLYLANAQTKMEPMELVGADYAKLWRDRAFPGEWVQKEDGKWIQK